MSTTPDRADSRRVRPLAVTGDARLADDLLQTAAAAGTGLDVAETIADAAASWTTAPLVLVGGDAAADVAAAAGAAEALPRRSGVLLVTSTLDDPDVGRHAIAAGAEQIVFLPDGREWLIDRLADAAADASARGLVVAVIGARGGAGATSFAVALALAGARAGHRTLLADVDPFGGGIDLALGAEDVTGPRWDTLEEGTRPVTADALLGALPRCGDVTVLAWPRTAAPTIPALTVDAMLRTARRGASLVVVDVARSFDEASRVALSLADVALVVCPAELRACASGRRVADTVRLFVDDIRVVVRGPAPTTLTANVVADALDVPLAGWLDEEPAIGVALDEGRPPGARADGPLGQLCDTLVHGLLP